VLTPRHCRHQGAALSHLIIYVDRIHGKAATADWTASGAGFLPQHAMGACLLT
jgi:hypothetical protein